MCKHKRSRESISFIPQPDGHSRSVVTRWCFDCESRISLGPSDEHASEQVEIEIRAATLAARRGFGSFSNCGAGCERCGYLVRVSKNGRDAPHQRCNSRQFHAGYLARCIVEDGEP